MTPTKFDPEGKITREQFATILYRYSSCKGNATRAQMAQIMMRFMRNN